MNHSISALKKQLLQLKELHDAGALTSAQYEESKADLERRLLDAVLQAPAAEAASAPTELPAAVTKKASRSLYAVLSLGIVFTAGLGYWWTGSPRQARLHITPVGVGEAPAEQPHATNFDKIAAMTERLAARMQEQPDDAEGWAMLARSYSVLGKHPEALRAYEKAVALRTDDANLLADYADALAIKSNRNVAGEAMKQVNAALKIEPRNLKALSLAGTYAFDQKNYAQAAQYWGQVVQFGPANNPIVLQIGPALSEARELAGLSTNGAKSESGGLMSTCASGTISGTVSLSVALSNSVHPDDAVFIFARAAEGSRMPLAILRKQVRDLPVHFVLDDSTSMSPTNKLSTTQQIIVGARISKSGNAKPQTGDFSVQSKVVSTGTKGLTLELKDAEKL